MDRITHAFFGIGCGGIALGLVFIRAWIQCAEWPRLMRNVARWADMALFVPLVTWASWMHADAWYGSLIMIVTIFGICVAAVAYKAIHAFNELTPVSIVPPPATALALKERIETILTAQPNDRASELMTIIRIAAQEWPLVDDIIGAALLAFATAIVTATLVAAEPPEWFTLYAIIGFSIRPFCSAYVWKVLWQHALSSLDRFIGIGQPDP